MANATLVSALNTNSIPQYMFAEYECPSVGADSTSIELVRLELPARYKGMSTYYIMPNLTVTGKSRVIFLKGISASCLSSDFDISILNRNDITLLNTINEVLRYTGANKIVVDQSFDEFLVRNKDDTIDGCVYLFVNNHDNIPTGIIRLELIYASIQEI